MQSKTTVGIAFYINDSNNNINFVQLPTNADPYTAANPRRDGRCRQPCSLRSRSWELFAAHGFHLSEPWPTRQKGVELSVDHRLSSSLSAFANYSWQGDPEILKDPHPFPTNELSLPPTNRFNIGGTYGDKRWLGALTVNYTIRRSGQTC